MTEPDLEGAAIGARILLEALGVDLADESLARTPERMAASLAELTRASDADRDHMRSLMANRK